MKKLILLALLFAGSLMQAVKDMPGYTPSWMPPEIRECEQLQEEAAKFKAIKQEEAAKFKAIMQEEAARFKAIKQEKAAKFEAIKHKRQEISENFRQDSEIRSNLKDALLSVPALQRKFNTALNPQKIAETLYRLIYECHEPVCVFAPYWDKLDEEGQEAELERVGRCKKKQDEACLLFSRYVQNTPIPDEATEYGPHETNNPDYYKEMNQLRAKLTIENLKEEELKKATMLNAITRCLANEESEEMCLISSGIRPEEKLEIQKDAKVTALKRQLNENHAQLDKLRQELLALQRQEKGLASALD